MSMKPNWVWEPVPSVANVKVAKVPRDYFKGIDSLVQESIQNSIDARQDKRAEINITVIELSGDELKIFLAAMAWEDIGTT